MGQAQGSWRRLLGSRPSEAVVQLPAGPVDQAQFAEACAHAMRRTREGRLPALLLLRVDGAGDIDDGHGLTGGDELTRVIVQRLTSLVPKTCVLGRLGDHEFGVLFDHLPETPTAMDLGRRLVSTVGKPVFLASQRRVHLTASAGLATASVLDQSADAEELFRAARLAMREAQRSGRNGLEVCTPDVIAMADERLAIGQDLRRALDEQGLGVCYQPLVDLRDGAVMGFEALVRWSHPVHGQVPPDRFVPLAEEFGLITDLGHLVLSTATAQVQQWSMALAMPLVVHVNVSGADLAAEAFADTVAEALSASGLPAAQLVLELTESAVVPELESAREKLDALHALGVRVAMDDFGVSRAVMPHLQTLPVDILKVDRELLADEDSPRSDGLLKGLIALGQALGMEVFGEGIEDESQRERLIRHGCTVGQGYLFARPMTAGDTAAYLRRMVEPKAAVNG
jgi:diguanylate cyclase (GGDEF)-like protein